MLGIRYGRLDGTNLDQENMGPGYPDPMPAGSADPGAQCSDEQHMAPGAWSVKQELFLE